MTMDTFEERLLSWSSLREKAKFLPLEECLLQVNNWWQMLPITNHYLHVDDYRVWPNPWELLADNIFCDVAKALGIVYTLLLMEREDIMQCSIVATNNECLVKINNGIFLNYAPKTLLNTNECTFEVHKELDQKLFINKIG